MIFHSILFENVEAPLTDATPEVPAFFSDLYLDQIVDTITAGKEEYNLKPFFYASLSDTGIIRYRHEIMRDLENPNTIERIRSFSHKMRRMRQHLAMSKTLYYEQEKERWFLDAVKVYCDAVNCLANDLSSLNLQSRGLLGFIEYLDNYIQSSSFASLVSETEFIIDSLSSIKYCMCINGNAIYVTKYTSEIDYSNEVEKTFDRFKRKAPKDYRAKFTNYSNINHVEAKILELVSKLRPDIFMNLTNYCSRHIAYLDETIRVFDREIQFYIAYLEYTEVFKRAGLTFCYPELSTEDREVYSYDSFDLALAHKLIGEQSSVVCNDFYLEGRERILVVSGPNQGGKTTFARMFGQVHYMAGLGCPIPGRAARLFLFDRIFTHFEKEENINNFRGKLQDDLVRIHDILCQSTSNTIIIMNEIFTSTTLNDAVFLGKKILGKITELDLLCVFVTFIDELASFSEKTVSMVSTIDPHNPTLRTYRIIRRPADGLSYALSIAEKHRVTYFHLKERIRS